MPAPIFLGDEISATAYRLGGARVRIAGAEDPTADLAWACREAELVLITAEFAARLPADQRARAQSRLHPLVLVVPDLRRHLPLPDLVQWVRTQLGLEA